MMCVACVGCCHAFDKSQLTISGQIVASAVHGGGEVHGAAEGAGPGADQERAGDRVPVPAEGQRGRGQVHGRPADQGLRRAPAPGIPRDCDHEQHPALCQGQLLAPLTSHSFINYQLSYLNFLQNST